MARPPRCPGAWIAGNSWQLLRDTRALLIEGHRRCGPVFTLRVLGRDITVIAGDAASRFMAEGQDDAHLSRDRIFGPIQDEFGAADLVLACKGERHTRLRAPLATAYSRQVASPFVTAMVDAVRREAVRLPRAVPVGVHAETARFAFAQYACLLGPRPDRLSYADCKRITDYGMNTGAGLLPTLVFRAPWYRASHARAFGALRELLASARSRPASAAAPDLVDTLCGVRDVHGRPLTDDEVITYAAYGVAASIAYVGRVTAFMLYELLRSPALLEDVRVEADAAFGADRVASATDLRALRTLQAVYQETLRRHVISPGMPHHAHHDFAFDGYDVRAGDMVVVSPVPQSADPKVFPDPDAFDHRRPRGLLHPFGLGHRTCVATGLVEVMAVSMVASLVHGWAMTMEPAGYTLGLTTRPLPAPDARLRMRLDPRVAAPSSGVEQPAPAAVEQDAFTREVLARAAAQRFAPNALVIREGDAADRFYLIRTGTADVSRGHDGRHVARLGPGDPFGEAGLLLNAPRNATVTSGPEGLEALVLERDAFLDLVATSDLVAAEITAFMRERAASHTSATGA